MTLITRLLFDKTTKQQCVHPIKFNGREIYKTENLLPIIKRRLGVYASDNIYPAADGNMRYLMYRDGAYRTPSPNRTCKKTVRSHV